MKGWEMAGNLQASGHSTSHWRILKAVLPSPAEGRRDRRERGALERAILSRKRDDLAQCARVYGRDAESARVQLEDDR